jgi:hypothetical protein
VTCSRQPGPIHWDTIERSLLKGDGHLKPWEVWQLTLPELLLYLTDSGPRTASGGEPMSDGEIAEYIAWYQSLTNRQRLELAKRGEL